MCAVSFVGDHYNDRWRQPLQPYITQPLTYYISVSREEFDALKKEVEQMKDLLRRAKLYDEQTGQPDCEMEDKVALLKKVAEMVGVSLEDIFKPKA